MRPGSGLWFLYGSGDRGRVRQVRVPLLSLAVSAFGVMALLGMAGLWLAGLWQGASWLPGGSFLARENGVLRGRVSELETRVGDLRGELSELQRLHHALALAAGLEPLDAGVSLAGVGGRAAAPAGPESFLAAPAAELESLLRQARLQRQACEAMLDTLAVRRSARERLPSIRPVQGGVLSSGFGLRQDPFTGGLTGHEGLDICVPTGSPVRATAAGVVVSSGRDAGFGLLVCLDHGGGLQTVYAHLSRALVRPGQKVRRGQVIAESGCSGRVTAPHVHYEVRREGRPIDPAPFILDLVALP